MSDQNHPETPSIPDLTEPPIKEGVGGGPILPGLALSEHAKNDFSSASEVLNGLATGIATIAAGAAVINPVAGGVIGIFSGSLFVMSELSSLLAKDPPQPYEKIVTFHPRVSEPPETQEPILAEINIVTQQTVFALVTAYAYLDALERMTAAQEAKDLSWAVTHRGVALQSHWALIINLANVAAAIYAVGAALQGSSYDLALPVKNNDAVRDWIETPGMKINMANLMKETGLTAAEINTVIEWWQGNPIYSGPNPSLSSLIAQSAQSLYAVAEQLNTRWVSI